MLKQIFIDQKNKNFMINGFFELDNCLFFFEKFKLNFYKTCSFKIKNLPNCDKK